MIIGIKNKQEDVSYYTRILYRRYNQLSTFINNTSVDSNTDVVWNRATVLFPASFSGPWLAFFLQMVLKIELSTQVRW